MQQKKPRTPGSGSTRRRVKSAGAQPADVLAPTEEAVVAAERNATSERPSEDAIRTRAYYLYLERGARTGHDLDDWLRAEREMRA